MANLGWVTGTVPPSTPKGTYILCFKDSSTYQSTNTGGATFTVHERARDGRRRVTPAGAPCQHAGVANPTQPPDDPVLARRARIAKLVDAGQRIGYSLWLVAILVFVVGAVTRFRPVMATIVIGCLAAGSALLAPAIVIGYGIKAADRADRGEPDGH